MTDIINGDTFDIIEPELHFDITQLGQVEDFLTVPGPPGPPGGVQSVNGETGPTIVLDAADVGAATPADVAAAKDRANHTGTQTTATISDFTESVQDAVAALLTTGAQVSLTYNDAGNTLQISATGADAETMRDTIGAALVGVGNIAVTVNDAGDTITVSTTATANATDAQLRDRSTHTGTQAFTTITGTATTAQLGTGTPAAGTYVDGATGAWTTLPAGGSSGAPLGTPVSYNPAALTSVSTTSTTPVDVDATNLVVTFTAPASGIVEVVLSASAQGASGTEHWSLRQGTTNLAGTERAVQANPAAVRVTARIRRTGLTPGTTYTYKWAHRVNAGTGTTTFGGATEFAGVYAGPATMEVYAR